MSHQSEALLEKNLVHQLVGLGYASVKIQDADALLVSKSSKKGLLQKMFV